jgi:hypothetical protein
VSFILFSLTTSIDARPSNYQDQFKEANDNVAKATASIHADTTRLRQIKSVSRGGPLDEVQQAELDMLVSRINSNSRLAHESHRQRQEAERIASFLVSLTLKCFNLVITLLVLT